MSLPKRPPRRRALIAAALSGSLLVVPQAQSFERVVVGTRHFFECLGLMLSKPDVHEQECLPNNVVGPFDSLSPVGSGSVVVAAPPPPPPPPPEPEPPCSCSCPT